MKWMKVLGCSVFIIAIVCVFTYIFILSMQVMGRGAGSSHKLWEGSYLSESEWAYYKNRIGDIVQTWQRVGRESLGYKNNEHVLTATTALIIDTNKPSIRLEQNGNVYKHYAFDLSTKINWSVGISDPSGNKPLVPPVVIRYIQTSRPEQIYMHAVSSKGHFTIHFSKSGRGMSSGYGGVGEPGKITFSSIPTD